MAKYNYDKSALKGLGVGAFLSEVKVREAHIAAAGDEMPQSVFNSNILAEKLHPEKQCVKIAKVVDHDDARSYTLVPDTSRGTKGMAYFRAGQYVAVELNHVLSDEAAEGYEHGFITAELIKKYAGEEDYSLFLCGPKAMYGFADKQIAELGLPRRRARKELYGEYGDPARDASYPKGNHGKSFSLTVSIWGEKQTISCRANQTLLSAMEQAGIKAPSRCRSGQCGWCHSRLVSGEVFIPDEADGRREADKKFGWIHPCCTYPLSDIELDVPAIM